jgi:beta-galactosidase
MKIELYFKDHKVIIKRITQFLCYSLRNPLRPLWLLILLIVACNSIKAQNPRSIISLNENWTTIANDTITKAYDGFELESFITSNWKKVDVPHNWDQYEGYRRLKHGNLHGYAWYRKEFTLNEIEKGKRYFLYFEGVGSYANIWLNGKQVGTHSGGRTTFTIDVSQTIRKGRNLLAVRADHPSGINDLPWVCGGCSTEWGFSEGSQPMGIFRPVQLIITNFLRIEPFGIHIWNSDSINETTANINIETELKNYGNISKKTTIIHQLVDASGKEIFKLIIDTIVPNNNIIVIKHKSPEIKNPNLWSLENPYLYQLKTVIKENGKIVDSEITPYGIRWISWPIGRNNRDKRFFLNGKPVFINGISEYEHNMGKSHAFSNEQIETRINQIQVAGFNAFRDAHQPHNLLYQKLLDKSGMLWWPQFAAHIWFDTPEFRNNFKTLLRDWVKERRNSPSIILWGLENESTLPTDFAQECSEIIRELDPTTSSQRKITTCNGGTGADWNVVQNWSGTYGGNPDNYDIELKNQLLNGEYGAWRSIDRHTEGPFLQNSEFSENRFNLLMESKIRLAESIKDSVCGQFHWLFNSHENPGRVQNGEGYREIDRLGPINYKGLLTTWGEPTDGYYLYFANYASKEKTPIVYIVSHTWPDRWTTPGIKDSIIVYSNCDEVELFNGDKKHSLGIKKNPGRGNHFQWDGVNIQYNALIAVGYINGVEAAQDAIVMHHLPQLPGIKPNAESNISSLQTGQNYVYRVNCGGPNYTDTHKNKWMADVQKTQTNTWGSLSWTGDFKALPAFYGSQRRTFDEIAGTDDSKLFQTFRFGGNKLRYCFPLTNGNYIVELYFIEPWYGTGGKYNCSGWRLFDVAFNDSIVVKNIDIWKEVGHDVALKKTINYKVSDDQLTISFPNVLSGQAIISAIAISTTNSKVTAVAPSASLISSFITEPEKEFANWSVQKWMDTGDRAFIDDSIRIASLPSNLYASDWISTSKTLHSRASFVITSDADVFIGSINPKLSWLKDYSLTNTSIKLGNGQILELSEKRFHKNDTVVLDNTIAENLILLAIVPVSNLGQAYDLRPTKKYEAENVHHLGNGIQTDSTEKKKCIKISDVSENTVEWKISLGLAAEYSLRIKYINTTNRTISGVLKIFTTDSLVLENENIKLPVTERKWKTYETTTGGYINAGNYRITLTIEDAENLYIDALEVQ